MARGFLTAIDLNKNELQNAAIQNLGTAPSSPVKGQLYYNSTGGDDTLYWWNGTVWVAAKDAGATSVFYQTVRDDGTARTQRGALNFVSTTGIAATATDDAANNETEISVDPIFGASTAQTTFGLAKSDGVAGTLPRSDHTHGTPVHDDAAHSAIHLNALAAPTADVSMGGFKVTNLATPASGTDAANKSYVDNITTGMSWKNPVRAASTANVTLASPGATMDGVTLVSGDRVLLKNQTTTADNGIYVWTGAAALLTRATDADTGAELVDAAVFVAEGTTQADTAWVQTTNAPITIGSTAVAFVQFSGAGAYTAGAGLTQSGTTFNVGAGTGIVVNADDVAIGDPELLAIAGLVSAADRVPIFTGSGTAALLTVLTPAQQILDDGSFTQMRGTMSAAFNGIQIATTAPLQGGGDLTANRTLTIDTFTSTVKGAVPPPTTVTGKFLKDDGTWATVSATDTLGPDGDKGDITVGGTGTTLTIDTGAVTNAKLATMAGLTIKGSVAGGTPADLSAAQVKSILAYTPADIAAVPNTRAINTTAPLTGGGNLGSDLTLAVSDFTSTTRGTVPASGGGTANFLRADGTWVTPGGGGTVNKFSADCAAATSTVVTHNLNTRDVLVQVYRTTTPWDQVECDVEHTSTTTCTVRFAAAPTAGQYRIVVTG